MVIDKTTETSTSIGTLPAIESGFELDTTICRFGSGSQIELVPPLRARPFGTQSGTKPGPLSRRPIGPAGTHPTTAARHPS